MRIMSKVALALLWTAQPTWRRRQWQATPVLLPGKFHGWRSLVGCSPWGRHESDTTERLHFHFSLSHNGKGNGSALQCSCLENPRDGRAWWAAICGVTQSWTRLWNGLEWVNLTQMTVISTTAGRHPSEEMEWPSWSTKESEMQYLDAISRMTEWSLFVSKANHSISQ